MTEVGIRRYATFSDDPGGGNPAGVVLNAAGMSDRRMQRIAAEVGYSETAFVTGAIVADGAPVPIRYFAPELEVDFCGHATIATAVAIGEVSGLGTYTLATNVGPVQITARREGEHAVGSLRSPEVDGFPLEPTLLTSLLAALG